MNAIAWNYEIILKKCWIRCESLCACIHKLAASDMLMYKSPVLLLKLACVGCGFLVGVSLRVVHLSVNVLIACSIKCLLVINCLLINLLIKRILLILYFISKNTKCIYTILITFTYSINLILLIHVLPWNSKSWVILLLLWQSLLQCAWLFILRLRTFSCIRLRLITLKFLSSLPYNKNELMKI